MESTHIRQMLKKIDSKKYNLEPTFKELEEFERLAKIGKATEKILSINDYEFGPTMLIGDEYGDLSLYSVEELLEWAESEGEL